MMFDEIRNYPNIKERFLRKIEKQENGCWLTTSKPILNSGYAQFSYGKYGKITAHRLSYVLFNGDIKDGLKVCHSCDNKRCVNPGHLWLGTQKQNLQDMKQKGRSHKSKLLSDNDINDIKQKLKEGHLHKNIAADFGICRAYVTQISLGKRLVTIEGVSDVR